jgi:hypothetical protein
MRLKPLLQWTRKDDLTLSHVHLTPTYAEACDGFGLVRVPGAFGAEALLRGDDLRAIRVGAREPAEVHLEADHAVVTVGEARYRVRLCPYTYPDTDAFWPQGEAAFAIKVAAPLLKRLADLALAYDAHSWMAVHLTFFAPDKPLTFAFETTSGSAEGLIMPMLR